MKYITDFLFPSAVKLLEQISLEEIIGFIIVASSLDLLLAIINPFKQEFLFHVIHLEYGRRKDKHSNTERTTNISTMIYPWTWRMKRATFDPGLNCLEEFKLCRAC